MPLHTSRATTSGTAMLRRTGSSTDKEGFDISTSGVPQIVDASGNVAPVQANLDSGRIFFSRYATITSAAAVTAVTIIADSEVPAGKKVYVTDFSGRVNGTTVWGTTATVKIQDTNGTPVDFVTVAVAAMTSQARVYLGTANVTDENARSLGTGGTAAKGLVVKGDANGTGSDFVVWVNGYIA